MWGNTRALIVLLILVFAAGIMAVSPAEAARPNGPGDILYAADSNHDLVHVYNVSAPRLAKVDAIPLEKPAAVEASHSGKYVYVTSSGILTPYLYVISTENNTVLTRYQLPDNGAEALAVSPDDKYVYTVTSTRFIILDTTTGKITEKTLDTDRYTTITATTDPFAEFAYIAAPGSGKLLVYNAAEDSLTSYHLNCEVGHLEAIESTRLLSTDRLGEINVLKYNYFTGIEGWSYTPHPIGGTSVFLIPYIAVSNDKKMAYYLDPENNKVYQVNLNDYSAVLLTNVSDWRSPTRAAFSQDDSKVFICDDTGVMGLYTKNNSQFQYYYGYKAMDVTIASIPGSAAPAGGQPTPTPAPLITPVPAYINTSASPTPAATSVTTPVNGTGGSGSICPTLAILPLLIIGVAACGSIRSRQSK